MADQTKAAYKELVRRGLIKSGSQAPSRPAPQPVQEEPGILSRGLSALQDDARMVVDNIASPNYWKDFTIPFTNNVSIPIGGPIGQQMLAQPATRLVAARAYQGLNPVAQGDAVNIPLENNPDMQRGAVQLADTIGDTPAAAVQFGAQILPNILAEAGAGSMMSAGTRVAPAAYTAASQALPRIVGNSAKSGATSATMSAAFAGASAEEGKRGQTFQSEMMNPLSWLLGAAPSAAGDAMAIRDGNRAALADIGSNHVDPVRLAEERAGIHQLTQEQIDAIYAASREPGMAGASPAAQTLQRREQIQRNIDEMVARHEEAAAREPTQVVPMPGDQTVAGQVGLGTLLDMTAEDRARYVGGVADDALARMKTVVDPSMADTSPVLGNLGPMPGNNRQWALPEAATSVSPLMPREGLGMRPNPKNAYADLAGNPGQLVDPVRVSNEPTKAGGGVATKNVRPINEGQVAPNSPEALQALPSVAETRDIPLPASMQKTQADLRFEAKTDGFDWRDVARVTDENPAYVRKQMYGSGHQNMGAARYGTPTEVLSHDQIAVKQSRRTPAQIQPELYEAQRVLAKMNRNKLKGPEVDNQRQIVNQLVGELRAAYARKSEQPKLGQLLARAEKIKQEIAYFEKQIAKFTPNTSDQVRKSYNDKLAKARQDLAKIEAKRGQDAPVPDARTKAEQASKADPRSVETPGEVIQPGGLPKDVDIPGAALEDVRYAQQKLKEARDPSVFQEIAKKLLLPEHRAIPIVGAAIRGHKAATHLQNVQVQRLFPQLKRVLAGLSQEENRLIRRFIKQNVSPQKNTPPIPVAALPRQFRELFEAGMEQNRYYRDELIKAGYFGPDQVKHMQELEARGHVWLHRDFRAFLDNKYLPDRGLMDRTIRWLVKESKGALDYAGASNELINLMSGTGDIQNRWRQSKLNKEILKSRSQIPPIIRDVLGEIHDPAYVVASSMSELERLWRQHKVSQSFTDPAFKGQVWDDKPSRDMAPQRVWDENASPQENLRSYGMFAGKYVSPQLYESIMQAPAPVVSSLVKRMGSWITGAMKTAKIALSPVTYMNNWLGNSAYAAAAGLPMWNSRFVPRLVQAAKAMSAYGDTFLTKRGQPSQGADGQWMQWALEDGAIIPGTGEEFGGAQAKQIVQRFLSERKPGLEGFLDAGWNAIQQKKAKLGSIYDALDTHWRLAVYIEQVTKGRERLGLPMAEARARASKIINENFASSGSVGQAVREMSNTWGLFAPFLTWHADNIRVHTNWLRNSGRGLKPKHLDGKPIGDQRVDAMAGEGSAQALNVALHYGLISGTFEMLRRLYNFTDQDVAVAEASTKASYKGYNPGPVRQWLPWRDNKGRAQVMSLVPFFPSAVFLKGDPDQFLLSRAMQATMQGFVQGGGAEEPVNRALNLVGLGSESFKAEVLPGQEGRAALEAAWNYLEPGLIRDVRNVARRTQVAGALRRYEEPYTPGQAVAALTPFKVEPVGKQSQESERRREVATRRETSGDMRQINRLTVSPDEQERLRRATLKEIETRQKKASQRSKAIRGNQ